MAHHFLVVSTPITPHWNTNTDACAETEAFSQSLARSSALSWFAGHADFESMNNFAKGEQEVREDSNLEQSKRAIVEVKASLDKVITFLPVVAEN